jgi:hypothetical protein
MPVSLGPVTKSLVNSLFAPEDREKAIQLLMDECGRNIPMYEHEAECELDDLRLSILYASKGDLEALRRAIDVAKQDYRDALSRNVKAIKREAETGRARRGSASSISFSPRWCGAPYLPR